MKFPRFCLHLAGLAFVLPGLSLFAEARRLDSDLQLVADRSIIEYLSGGATLRLGQPVEREVIFKSEKPWEGTAFAISSIYQHEGVYHLLYRGLNEASGKEDASSVYLCLATSRDGIHWERPELGLVEFQGSKANNITASSNGTSQTFMFTFYDPRPGIPADERVKGIDMRDGERRAGAAGKGLRAAILGSADGRVWHDLNLGADLQSDWPNAFDGGSVFWSETEQLFVGYFRWWDTEAPRHARTLDDWMIIRPGVRSVFRSVSKDLKSWSKPEPMSFGDTPREHIYEAPTVPYFRNPKLYLSLATRFNPGRRALTLEEERALAIRDLPGQQEHAHLHLRQRRQRHGPPDHQARRARLRPAVHGGLPAPRARARQLGLAVQLHQPQRRHYSDRPPRRSPSSSPATTCKRRTTFSASPSAPTASSPSTVPTPAARWSPCHSPTRATTSN